MVPQMSVETLSSGRASPFVSRKNAEDQLRVGFMHEYRQKAWYRIMQMGVVRGRARASATQR